MASLAQLAEGIRRAHAAGKTEEVKALGAAYRAMQKGEGAADPFAAASAKSQTLQGGPGARPQEPVDLATATAATINGIVSGIPIAGPLARNITDAMQGGVAALTGGDYAETVEGLQQRREDIAERAPIADIAGTVAGGFGGLGAAAKVPAVAEALGITGAKFLPRVANSTVSSAAIAGTDQAVKGGSVGDVIEATLAGGAGGLAIPVVGEGLRQGVKAAGRVIAPTAAAIFKPAQEALRRSGTAFARDAKAGGGSWGAADEAAARSAQIPVVNADRGGETVRALSRSVANQSPEARETIKTLAENRFGTQGARAEQVVRDVAGGAVDDIGYQAAIRQAAQKANEPAYKAAYKSPQAQNMWSEGFARMFHAPAFRTAVKAAEGRAANRSVVEGFEPVHNPFVFDAADGVALRDPNIKPTLQFWDQVKRNLDGAIDEAKDRTLRADLIGLKRQLVQQLDEAVPEYQAARLGAAKFFDAEDALDAGKKFGGNMRMVPEAKAAFAKFSAPDKAAFRTGYASTLIDRVKAAGDRTNVINQVFKSPAAREMNELVFGKAKALELEAYVRAETLADMLRGAMGNSTTARQLMEMGLGAGSGYVLSGGDLMGAGAGALAARGARHVGQRVDNRVMQMVAKLLMSDNPDAIKLAVAQAMKSPAYMEAMERLSMQLAAPARGALLAING